MTVESQGGFFKPGLPVSVGVVVRARNGRPIGQWTSRQVVVKIRSEFEDNQVRLPKTYAPKKITTPRHTL